MTFHDFVENFLTNEVRKSMSMPRNYYVHPANSAVESQEMFADDPEYGGKIKRWGLRIPSWSYLVSWKPDWVLFKELKFTCADPYWWPCLNNYRQVRKLIAQVKIPGDVDFAIWPINLDTVFRTLQATVSPFFSFFSKFLVLLSFAQMLMQHTNSNFATMIYVSDAA